MEKKNRNEELQSRREFFKKAAKGALPILGAVVLACTPNIVKAAEGSSTGCSICMNTCYGCTATCAGKCNGICRDSCANNCRSSCQSKCYGTSKRG